MQRQLGARAMKNHQRRPPQKQAPPQQRRTFRGRCGATDGELPNSSARRGRKRQPQQQEKDVTLVGPSLSTGVCEENDQGKQAHIAVMRRRENDNDFQNSNVEEEEVAKLAQNLRVIENCNELNEHSEKGSEAVSALNSGYDSDERNDDADVAAVSLEEKSPEEKQLDKEMQILLRRIQKNRESMQLSAGTGALDRLSNYEAHVLRAVQNRVNEWKAILRHYANIFTMIQEKQTEKGALRSQLSLVGLTVFEIIQYALQCGPLAGAQAGYFKRCGADVARTVQSFLKNILPTREDATALYFSEKQVDAIERWKLRAQKAIEKDKPPSKSISKRQDKEKKKRSNKNKK